MGDWDWHWHWALALALAWGHGGSAQFAHSVPSTFHASRHSSLPSHPKLTGKWRSSMHPDGWMAARFSCSGTALVSPSVLLGVGVLIRMPEALSISIRSLLLLSVSISASVSLIRHTERDQSGQFLCLHVCLKTPPESSRTSLPISPSPVLALSWLLLLNLQACTCVLRTAYKHPK